MECGKDTHCCWIPGHQESGLCKYLVEQDGYRCSLRMELGSWESVYEDQRYIADVKPTMDALGQGQCGDWPRGVVCAECG